MKFYAAERKEINFYWSNIILKTLLYKLIYSFILTVTPSVIAIIITIFKDNMGISCEIICPYNPFADQNLKIGGLAPAQLYTQYCLPSEYTSI